MGGDHYTDALNYALRNFGASAAEASDALKGLGDQIRGYEPKWVIFDEAGDFPLHWGTPAKLEPDLSICETIPGWGTFS
jgi:hypothetical protein